MTATPPVNDPTVQPAPAPTPEPTPAPVASPLGVDPTPAVPAVAPTATPTPVPATIPSGQKVLTEAEHTDLLERASAFDIVERDPKLAEMVSTYLKDKGAQPTPVDDPTNPVSQPNPEIEQMKKSNQAMMNELLNLKVNTFRTAHPDMKGELEQRMAVLCNSHNHDLDSAYIIAKAEAQAVVKPTVAPVPTAPTTEVGGPGEITGGSTSDALLEQARKLIDDPKATPRIEDAFDIALATAKQLHGE